MHAARRARPLPRGERLDGRYEILGVLGSGGMGVVYEARRLVLDDRVAIKCLREGADGDEIRARFLTEARAAAHVRHPNVVAVFDFGEPADAAPYMVMELLHGETLAARLARVGALDPEVARFYFGPMCAAVEAGHRRGVIHRDLKSANVMLARTDDDREIVKVLDFGLAQIVDRTTSGARPTHVAGTCGYLAPELVEGGAASPASDVFALGVILYEMVTGALPFEGETPLAVLASVLGGAYRPPEDRRPDLPAELGSAIHAALSPRADERPASPEQLARLAAGSRAPVSRRAPPRAPAIDTVSQPTEVDIQIAARAAPTVDHARPLLDRFVGREAELALLHTELAEALHGRGRIVLLRGEPGLGKSRLADQLVRSAAAAGARVCSGRFFDYEGSRPPACEVFLMMLQDGRRTAIDVARLPDDRLLREATHGEPAGSGEGARWRLMAAIADAFAALAGHEPLVLVFDDVQWASPLDLEMIEHLHRSLGRRGTLVACVTRDAEAARPPLAPWIASLGKQRALLPVDLGPLSVDEIDALLRAMLPGLAMRREDVTRVARLGGGNPWLLGEIVSRLIATGDIARAAGAWRCGHLGDVDIPASVVALLEARVATCPEDVRGLLEIAAVLGDDFRVDTLAAAAEGDLDEPAVDGLLDEAERLGLVTRDAPSAGNDYRFRSDALRRVVYDGLRRPRRQGLHRRVAKTLASRYARDLARIAPVLAWHHASMGDDRGALAFALSGARDALHRYDEAQAGVLAARAEAAMASLEAAGDDTTEIERAQLAWLKGSLAQRRGDAEAVSALERAAAIALRENEPALALDALLELVQAHLGSGDLVLAEASAAEAAVVAERAGDRSRALTARSLQAGMLMRRGETARSETLLEALIASLRADDPPSVVSLLHRERAWQLLKRGAFRDGEVHARRAMALARSSGDMLAQHHAIAVRAAIVAESGDHLGALPFHEQALELSRRLSLRRREAIDLANLGESKLACGRLDEALASFEAALAIFVAIGDRACEGDCSFNVGRVLLAVGRLAEAERMLAFAHARCAETGRREYAGLSAVSLVEIALARRDHAGATRLAEEAVGTFRAIASHHLWRALGVAARAREQVGDLDAARELAVEAVAHVDALRSRLPTEGDHEGFEREVAPITAMARRLGAGG